MVVLESVRALGIELGNWLGFLGFGVLVVVLGGLGEVFRGLGVEV